MVGWLVVLSNTIPLDSPEKEYYQSLTALDYLVTFVLAGLTLMAGLTLFLLRRVAAWLFTLSLILGLTHTGWHLSSKGLASTMNAFSLAGLFIQWGLLAWACLYSWGLVRKGRLN
jgi:disulfide bond formation protein DsbB